MVDKEIGISDTWPEDGIEHVERCPVCGAEDSETLYTGLTDRVFFCAPGEWTLVRCRSCESGYLNPRPTPDTIDLAYREYFTHESQPGAKSNDSSGRNWIRQLLGNGYRNWRFGTTYKPASRIGIIAVLLDRERRARIDASMYHLPRPRKGQKLLDFGCGNGAFLRRAREAGWNAVGLDFDEKAVRAAQADGLDVSQGGLDVLSQWVGEFDAITLSHVIEHVHDPKALLGICRDALKRGGMLWIETPNVNSQGHQIYGRDWRDLDPPRHLVVFTAQSLTDLLWSVGFNSVAHQMEHPVIPAVFGASEAIRAGQDPIAEGPRLAQANRKQWGPHRKARKSPGSREFITIVART